MKNKYKIKKNKLGYYYAQSNLNSLDLEKYYTKKYFKFNKNFNYKFNALEEKYFQSLSNIKLDFILRKFKKKNKPNILDIGAGTGRFSNAISSRCKTLTLVDFDKKQLQYRLKKNMFFIKSNPLEFIKNKNLDYDIISLNNVIEHVLNPILFLKILRRKIKKNTLVFISLPNDFSNLQLKLLKEKKVKTKYWINFPDHLSYFNTYTFTKFIKNMKFRLLDVIGDFPIELLLLSDNLNYVNDKSQGKVAHYFRCLVINHLYENKNKNNLIKLLKIFSDLGICRNNFFLLKK